MGEFQGVVALVTGGASGIGRAAVLGLARPEEVAEAVLFLASPRAGFITGQTLSVSGGLTMV